MKHSKKVIALALLVVSLFAISVTALAAADNPPTYRCPSCSGKNWRYSHDDWTRETWQDHPTNPNLHRKVIVAQERYICEANAWCYGTTTTIANRYQAWQPK